MTDGNDVQGKVVVLAGASGLELLRPTRQER